VHVSIKTLYREAPLVTRLFLQMRSLITGYDDISSELPTDGKLLDLGCGHGLFAFTLSLGDERREVIAVDHDLERVLLAESAAQRLPVERRPKFEAADLRERLSSFAAVSLDGIAMIDVLHYFDRESQEKLIRDAARALKPGGTFVMREVDSDAGARFVANRLYERAATGVRFTKSATQTLLFRGKAEWTDLLERAGFTAGSRRSGPAVFADTLFVAKKRA
jgi:ubiquinone/menaquinone biosynthesis C-methylase UbiE